MRRLLPIVLLLLGATPAVADELEMGFMPSGDTFEPLAADPYWPVFNVGYQHYVDDDFLENLFHAGIGETVPIYRTPNVRGLDAFEFGAQAAAFSVFDQDKPSNDQFNSDFFGGIYLAGRRGPWSGMARLIHRSSHVGDEFLINDGAAAGVTRENFGFERVDLYLSRDFADAGGFTFARLYGGGGSTLASPNPDRWEHWRLQYGAELRSPELLFDFLRPVLSADVQHQEGNDFKFDVSVRGGVQIEHPSINGRSVRFLLEYYNGREVNGQFWEDDLQYFGFGIFINL